MNAPVVIQCDASGEGLGATLLQKGRPITSASRSLTPAERNYVALELECLAIVFVCRKFIREESACGNGPQAAGKYCQEIIVVSTTQAAEDAVGSPTI